jgi:preprotein translocase subunit SecG
MPGAAAPRVKGYPVFAANLILWASAWSTLLGVALGLCATFLILLVLIQRGKGGGLAGAFGGAGGSSAFGSRAGDTFTRITIYVALVWVILIMITIKLTQPRPAEKAGSQEVSPSVPEEQ